MCGKFEKTGEQFTNHHINHIKSDSHYWNLIRLCKGCHEDITKNKGDCGRDRKIKQIKKDLFRRLIGSASLEVLLLASKHKSTTTLPCLANILQKMDLIDVSNENVFSVGNAGHSTIAEYRINKSGVELLQRLNIK